MPKVTLPRLTSGYLDADVLNAALAAIEAAFDNTLSRDGDVPNQMTGDLDLNGKRLLNIPTATTDNEPVTLAQLRSSGTGYVNQQSETYTATGGEGLVSLSTVQYQPGTGNLAVYVDGVRVFAGAGYTETSATSVTFSPTLTAGQKAVFVVNEYLATIDVSNPVSVSWSILTNIPAYASRWPTYDEVTGKPSSFTPSSHVHSATEITSGRLADARRGVYVQSTEPAGLGVGDAGVLWFW